MREDSNVSLPPKTKMAGDANGNLNIVHQDSISKNLDYFKDLSSEEIMNERKNKFLKIGRNQGFISNSEDLSTLTIKDNNFDKIFKSKKVLIGSTIAGIVLLLTAFILF